MTALEHELATAQVVLFQKTGKLLEAAESVRLERENYMRLLKEAAEQRKQEAAADDR